LYTDGNIHGHNLLLLGSLYIFLADKIICKYYRIHVSYFKYLYIFWTVLMQCLKQKLQILQLH